MQCTQKAQDWPVIILDVLTGVEPVDSPEVEPILAWSFTVGSEHSDEINVAHEA